MYCVINRSEFENQLHYYDSESAQSLFSDQRRDLFNRRLRAASNIASLLVGKSEQRFVSEVSFFGSTN